MKPCLVVGANAASRSSRGWSVERDESRLNQLRVLDGGGEGSHLNDAQPNEQRAVEAQACDARGAVMVASWVDDGLIGLSHLDGLSSAGSSVVPTSAEPTVDDSTSLTPSLWTIVPSGLFWSLDCFDHGNPKYKEVLIRARIPQPIVRLQSSPNHGRSRP